MAFLFLNTLSNNNERIIHGLKTAFACFIGFAFTKIIGFHADQWLIITILVVMCAQSNVGGVVQKSYMRFLGTLAGSLIAAITIVMFGTDPMVVAIAVASSALFFSYIAVGKNRYNDAGTLGAVTTAIILIGQNATLAGASERFLEISLGILIATLVSQFVLPAHARTLLIRNQATTFRQLRAYYLATLLTDQNDDSQDNYKVLDGQIVKSLLEQQKLAADAVHEPLKNRFNLDNFGESLFCEREILRCITFMHHAFKASPDTKNIFSRMNLTQSFHEQTCKVLESFASYLEQRKAKEKIVIILPGLTPLKEAIETEKSLNPDDMVYACSFLFCAEILLKRLEQLVILINKLNADFLVVEKHD